MLFVVMEDKISFSDHLLSVSRDAFQNHLQWKLIENSVILGTDQLRVQVAMQIQLKTKISEEKNASCANKETTEIINYIMDA